MSTSYECIEVDVGTDVATITFNRPEKKNCMSPTLHRNMCDALIEIEKARVKAVVITGAGDAFCGGMDLEQFFLEPFDDYERLQRGWQDSFTWLKHIKQFPAVTIAMVNGWCFGGGYGPLFACDLAICADEAQFGLSEINWGILPGGGATKVVCDLMPMRKAMYHALLGENLGGKEAEAAGLVNESVPAAQLRARVEEVAGKLLKKNWETLKATKDAVRRAREMTYDNAEDYLIRAQEALNWHDKSDGRHVGMKQFLDDKSYKPGLGAYRREK